MRGVFLIVFLCIYPAFAEEISSEELQKINAEVSKDVETRVRDIVTPLLLAEKLKMPFPPLAPTRKVDDIEKEVELTVQKMVDEKFPLSEVKKQQEAAAKKYFLYKEGDEVDLKVNIGRVPKLKGKFTGYSRKGELIVGGFKLPKVDMTEKVMVHFDPVLNKKKRETLVKNKLFYFYEDRAKMKKDESPKVRKKLFAEAGYFIKDGKFLKADEYLKKFYIEEKERVGKLLQTQVEVKSFAKYGYMKSGGSWVSKDAIVEKADDKEGEGGTDNLTEETPEVPEVNEQERKKEPLFDPKFYDPDF